MHFWNKHVQHISFRLCITFCEHRQLKGWQPHVQLTVAKSSISTSVHWFAAVTQNHWEHNHCIVTNLGDHNSVTRPSASLHMTSVSSAAATKGWAWCNLFAGLMECSALRKIKLLVREGSGCLEFQERMAGMDFWKKHVPQISFGSVSHFANMRRWKAGRLASNSSWKAGRHASNSLLLKAQSQQMFVGLQQSRSTTESTITIW